MEISFLLKSLFIILILCPFILQTIQGQETSQKSSPADLVDALHTTFGDNHSRAVHAKGIILEGTFTPDPQAATISKAAHLQKKASKVVLRFSDFTGIPTIPDNSSSANPRGLALKFLMPNGFSTDIVSHSFNGFPTSDSDQFRELLLAIAASGPEAQKPTSLDNFLGTHPIAKTFLTTQNNPKSFGAINYYGVNSFEFTNAKGKSVFIRYQFIPEAGVELLTNEEMEKSSADYLMVEIKKRISENPIRYIFYAQIAQDRDIIENPAIAWPNSRKLVPLGIIEITKVSDNTEEADQALFFIPNNVPEGIKPADPMIDFRSKAYPVSVKVRREKL